MCEIQWHAVAEICLKKQDQLKDIYCLCSRVFIRNKDDSLKPNSSADPSASEEELVVEDKISHESNLLPNILKNKIRQDIEHESVSCYCSASHTDNLSTDEHDSLRDSHEPRVLYKGLQSSDSGADLTEYVKHDIETDWHKYWSINGEKLIWESWIAKYSAYINPNYLQSVQDPIETDNKIEGNDIDVSQANNSIDDKNSLILNIEPIFKQDQLTTIEENCPLLQSDDNNKTYETEIKNRILVRNLSGSDDKLNTEISEGWNPLSPISIDCETDIEQLLSSKCGSLASSSIRTVDSMTNVTRMTISSIDLSQSSNNSDSFSSVSSVQSSLSSTSSEGEEDYQHQWSVLWKKHYEDEFLKQYQLFTASWIGHNINDNNDEVDIPVNVLNSSVNKSNTKNNIHKVFQGKVEEDLKSPIQLNSKITNSLGNLLNNLNMDDKDEDLNHIKKSSKEIESDCEFEDNFVENKDVDKMIALGLPTAFGSKGIKRKNFGESQISIKHSDFEPTKNKIKAAFNLLGIEFNNNNKTGKVNYKMKHIRLQNLQYGITKKPKHVYFDDDGNILPENTNTPEENKLLSILPDSSDNKLSSGDEEIVSNEPITTPQKFDKQTDEASVIKRRKRKRKLVMPLEIRDNRQLRKYWHRRFELFSKFDEGIKLDEESWYSVTPEFLAKHTAERCKCDVIIDGFCGAGGNAIQFAFTCKKVIAIDIDKKKIELAKHNAEVYGVSDRIEFIVGDFLQLAEGLKADVVFLSPPWGGPSYTKQNIYNLESMLKPAPISQLLETVRKITENIAIFLPKNSDTYQLMDKINPSNIELEQNIMRNNLVAITAYYNDLVKKI